MNVREQADLHNTHAPAVLLMLMLPQQIGETTTTGSAVILESVLFGFLLVAKHEGMQPFDLLEIMASNVKARLEADARTPR